MGLGGVDLKKKELISQQWGVVRGIKGLVEEVHGVRTLALS